MLSVPVAIACYRLALGRSHCRIPVAAVDINTFSACELPDRCNHLLVQGTLGRVRDGSSGAALPDSSFSPPRIIGVLSATTGGNESVAPVTVFIGSLVTSLEADSRMRLALHWGEDYYSRCLALDLGESPPAACEILNLAQICVALDLSADNCMAITDFALSPASPPWGITTVTSVAGGETVPLRVRGLSVVLRAGWVAVCIWICRHAIRSVLTGALLRR